MITPQELVQAGLYPDEQITQMTVISNTTLISNFASISRLDLLSQLWVTLYISDQVFNEIQVILL